MAEHLAHIEVVDGSSPSVETIRKRSKYFNYQTFRAEKLVRIQLSQQIWCK